MRHPALLVIAAWIISGATCVAQGPLPPRFQSLTKEGRVRLTRVLGTPEIQHSYVSGTGNAFSADGKHALYVEDLSTGDTDGPRFRTRLHLWDVNVKGWPREFDLDGRSVTAFALHQAGDLVLLAGQTWTAKEKKQPHSYMSLWDLKAGKAIHTFPGNEHSIHSVALAADAATALTGNSNGQLQRWDLKQGKKLADYDPKTPMGGGWTDSVMAMTILPGGKRFLAGYLQGEVRSWDVLGKDKPLHTFKPKTGSDYVGQLAASRDGKRFAAGDLGSFIWLCETDTGKTINTLRIGKDAILPAITALALADDGRTVYFTWEGRNPTPDNLAFTHLTAWDGDANKTLWTKEVPYRGRVPMLVQGDKLMVGGGPNRFDVWSIKDGNLLESWGGHKAPVNSVAVLANSDIVSAGQEGEIITWRKGQIAHKESMHGGVSAFAINKDRMQWLSAGNDLVLRHWPLDAKRPTFQKTHTGTITSLAFSADSRWACSGSNDRSVKTWNLLTGNEIATITGHSEGINAVAISPDDRWLASGSDDTSIRVWPIKDGKLDPDREPILLEKHKKPVTCLTFSPDGKRLISGGQDQTLMVWDLAKKSMDFMIPGHKNWITSLLLLDAKTVVTCSDDLSLCVWDLSDGMEIGRVDFGTVGDCPRCLAQIGPDRFLVGTSSWLIYEMQILPAGKSKAGKGSSR